MDLGKKEAHPAVSSSKSKRILDPCEENASEAGKANPMSQGKEIRSLSESQQTCNRALIREFVLQ